MAYSTKKRWVLAGSALALGLTGMAAAMWLTHNHTDPVSVGLFRVAVGSIVVGLGMRSYVYMDEVQRQAIQRRFFWGFLIGIAAMMPLVVALQTHILWLDAAVQFIFHHPATPRLYFSLGVVVPVMFQVVSALGLNLLDKLSQGSQP